ncbi:Ferric hydroxamate uptake [Hartmannibacter diazotrophicus]|uniref:Ferric hydroxamate uptake n=1 Tax=Hartmannibacter diazotrophicus TaxID=1482074 RepID=A0A2C9D8N7_9HYPH|nr:TonB-dependent siderophore receptor [Hartmannibacter diazotrophicus]SON56667.1 Ferric hydroxamate uptake [Hartmannibacter diazotrophicus]
MASTALAQDSVTLETIVLSGGSGSESATGPGTGYTAKKTTTGSKTATDIKDIPQSVSIVTRQQMDDRQPAQLEDAIAYSSGVISSNWGVDDRFDQFMIRGFDIGTYGIYRDGLSQKSINFSGFKIEPYGLERVEVLKGPVGVLYGENDAGGMVNAITKRPTFDRFAEGFASYGSFNTYEAGFDVGGSLNAANEMAFRLTGLYRDGETEIDGSENDRAFIAPAFTWKPDENTSLTILANYQSDKLTPNSFLPKAGLDFDASYGALPKSFQYSQSDFNKFDADHGSIGYQFEHSFNENWAVRQNLRFAAESTDYKQLYFDGMADATTMNYTAFTVDETATIFNVDNQLEWKHDFGPVQNTLLAGLDYSRYTVDGKNGWATGYSISILDPNYDFDVSDPAIYLDRKQTIDRVGLYAQTQAKILDHWNLTAGLRQSWVRNENDDHLYAGDSSQNDNALTKMIGLGYDFDNGITPYVGYSESFTTNTGAAYSGALFDPSKAHQYEVGVKYRPDGFNGFFTAALFDITKTNVLTSDPDHIFYQVQTGEVNHRGLELEANFDLMAGLSATTSYTYIDAEITKSNDGDQGNRPSMVPEHSAALWLNYKVQSGLLEGLSAGAGVRYVGSSYGDSANTIKVSDYAVVDAALRYSYDGKYEASLNVTNLLDNEYDATCYSGSGCIAGEGRVFTGKLTVKF